MAKKRRVKKKKKKKIERILNLGKPDESSCFFTLMQNLEFFVSDLEEMILQWKQYDELELEDSAKGLEKIKDYMEKSIEICEKME